ncbi:hypothetical protein CDD83_4071 [Cordyceps sp. RAO-2017]|nr:hypothetical protein CDD83_4071 [Cordyceps sp. RAO-2017]
MEGPSISDDLQSSFTACKQPVLQPQTVPETELSEPHPGTSHVRSKPKARCTSLGASKREAHWNGASPRPPISAPSSFRYLHRGLAQKPLDHPSHSRREQQPDWRQPSPHVPAGRTSPVQPHHPSLPAATAATLAPPPYRAYQSGERDHRPLHQRGDSFTFHIPRRQVMGDGSRSSYAAPEESPPRIPPKSQGWARVARPPEIGAIKDRVPGDMIEAERLQEQINQVASLQSHHACRSLSASHSVAPTSPGKAKSL